MLKINSQPNSWCWISTEHTLAKNSSPKGDQTSATSSSMSLKQYCLQTIVRLVSLSVLHFNIFSRVVCIKPQFHMLKKPFHFYLDQYLLWVSWIQVDLSIKVKFFWLTKDSVIPNCYNIFQIFTISLWKPLHHLT